MHQKIIVVLIFFYRRFTLIEKKKKKTNFTLWSRNEVVARDPPKNHLSPPLKDESKLLKFMKKVVQIILIIKVVIYVKVKINEMVM